MLPVLIKDTKPALSFHKENAYPDISTVKQACRVSSNTKRNVYSFHAVSSIKEKKVTLLRKFEVWTPLVHQNASY